MEVAMEEHDFSRPNKRRKLDHMSSADFGHEEHFHEAEGVAGEDLKHKRALSEPVSDEDSDSEVDEEQSFRHFLLRRKRQGANPRDILKSFGLPLPNDHVTDEALWVHILDVASDAGPFRKCRSKLPGINSLEDVVRLLERSSRILVLTGAGISVSSGIPDFRSRNGVYSRLEKEYDLPDPESMFDIHYFRRNPKPFFSFAKEIFPGQYKPSPAHRFIKLLETKGKLLRNYTQNIDTLEQVCGITKLLQCHGSFATASCIECRNSMDGEALRADIFAGTIPHCERCGGVIKPDIVFFHENLPDTFGRTLKCDRDRVDLVIVMGSSLQVHPVASVIGYLPAHVPQILINREVVGFPHSFDIELLGNCDDIVTYLCSRLSWHLDDAMSSRDLSRSPALTRTASPTSAGAPASGFPGALATPANSTASSTATSPLLRPDLASTSCRAMPACEPSVCTTTTTCGAVFPANADVVPSSKCSSLFVPLASCEGAISSVSSPQAALANEFCKPCSPAPVTVDNYRASAGAQLPDSPQDNPVPTATPRGDKMDTFFAPGCDYPARVGVNRFLFNGAQPPRSPETDSSDEDSQAGEAPAPTARATPLRPVSPYPCSGNMFDLDAFTRDVDADALSVIPLRDELFTDGSNSARGEALARLVDVAIPAMTAPLVSPHTHSLGEMDIDNEDVVGMMKARVDPWKLSGIDPREVLGHASPASSPNRSISVANMALL